VGVCERAKHGVGEGGVSTDEDLDEMTCTGLTCGPRKYELVRLVAVHWSANEDRLGMGQASPRRRYARARS